MDKLTLKEYFADPANSQTTFAKDMGVTPGAVWQWANHETRPMFERCKKIFRLTGGKVTGAEWYPDEQAYFDTLTLSDGPVQLAQAPQQAAGAAR